MADTTTFQAAVYSAQGTPVIRWRFPKICLTAREHAGDAPGGEGVSRQSAPGQRGDENPKVRRRRQSEAVEAEGHRPRSRRLDARAALGGWRYGLRTDPRSYAQYVPRQVRALARKSAFNARARENAIFIIDRFDYDAPEDLASQGARRQPRRQRTERS
jgi:large subunit ribosomal protein L4